MKKKNILLYFTDQQRADTCGCYGQELPITPVLDQLAAEGTRFDLAFTPQPVCGPCRAMAPVVDKLAEEHPEVRFGKVNVDEESELASQFGIFSIPTFLVVKDGKVQAQTAGARPKEALEALL